MAAIFEKDKDKKAEAKKWYNLNNICLFYIKHFINSQSLLSNDILIIMKDKKSFTWAVFYGLDNIIKVNYTNLTINHYRILILDILFTLLLY